MYKTKGFPLHKKPWIMYKAEMCNQSLSFQNKLDLFLRLVQISLVVQCVVFVANLVKYLKNLQGYFYNELVHSVNTVFCYNMLACSRLLKFQLKYERCSKNCNKHHLFFSQYSMLAVTLICFKERPKQDSSLAVVF